MTSKIVHDRRNKTGRYLLTCYIHFRAASSRLSSDDLSRFAANATSIFSAYYRLFFQPL
jgi:hypothetical protein